MSVPEGAVLSCIEEAELLCEQVKKGLLNFEQSVEKLLALEKKSRLAGDASTSAKVVVLLLKNHQEKGKYTEINELIARICKKRGQMKTVIIEIIKTGMEIVREIEEKETKKNLIQGLQSIANGKIFVEVEFARLIKMQADIFESEGKLDEAAQLIQDVQVESFTAMEKREKAFYILDQLRLTIATRNSVRAQIVRKKMNMKDLELPELKDARLRYYELVAELHLFENDNLNAAKACFELFKIQLDAGNDLQWKTLLENYVIFLIISPHSEESLQLLKELRKAYLRSLGSVPVAMALLDHFLSTEFIYWPLPYEKDLKCKGPFLDSKEAISNWLKLRSRVIEHDIIIFSKYYSRTTIERIQSLLQIDREEVENTIADLFDGDIIYARIDRPAAIVVFQKAQNSAEKLESWTSDVQKLVSLVEETDYLINNERMVRDTLEKRMLVET